MNPYAGIPFYRTEVSSGLVSFRVVFKQTDLLVIAERDLTQETLHLVRKVRAPLEAYLLKNPSFLRSLTPLPFDLSAPEIVKTMLLAGQKAGVGPMASVAGAIAEAIGRTLVQEGLTRVVAVENGGDVFLCLGREARVRVFAGDSIFSKLLVAIPGEIQPCGICTSSGRVGHSLSFGKADAVAVLARDTAYADATATALGNLLKDRRGLKLLKAEVKRRVDLLGVVAILEDELFLWGSIKLLKG